MGLWSGSPEYSQMLMQGRSLHILGHKRIKSLLEEANIVPCEFRLQYVGGSCNGSMGEKVRLSLQPLASIKVQEGREERSWLKSPPRIMGPGHEADAVMPES